MGDLSLSISARFAKDSKLGAVGIVLGSVYLTLQSIISTTIGVFGYAFMARMITQEQMGVIASACSCWKLPADNVKWRRFSAYSASS